MILILLAACDNCDEPIGIEVLTGVATAEYSTPDGTSLWTAQASPLDGNPGHGVEARRVDADGAVSVEFTFGSDGAEPCAEEPLIITLSYIHDDDGVHDGSASFGGLRSDGTTVVTSSWFGSGNFSSGMRWEGEGDSCTPSALRDDGTLDVFWSSDPADAQAYTAECTVLPG